MLKVKLVRGKNVGALSVSQFLPKLRDTGMFVCDQSWFSLSCHKKDLNTSFSVSRNATTPKKARSDLQWRLKRERKKPRKINARERQKNIMIKVRQSTKELRMFQGPTESPSIPFFKLSQPPFFCSRRPLKTGFISIVCFLSSF